jgi:hypothetical protein
MLRLLYTSKWKNNGRIEEITNGELVYLYALPDVIRVIRLRMMCLEGNMLFIEY